jgi:SAM-dependent methyltransferase
MESYQTLNPARAAAAKDVLAVVRDQLSLHTAVDVGCGLGYFSGLLDSLGLSVRSVDGRKENVEEASRRFPHISFQTIDAENNALRALGCFDLVLCFGLLYHLENPFHAIRNLHAMTSKLLLVESVVFPGAEPIMALVDEGPQADQGLHHIAFYPTESCLVKLLYKAGFANVYQFARMPDLQDYDARRRGGRLRTMLAASHSLIQAELLKPVKEPQPRLIERLWPDGNAEPTFWRKGRSKLKAFLWKTLIYETYGLRKRLGLRRRRRELTQ